MGHTVFPDPAPETFERIPIAPVFDNLLAGKGDMRPGHEYAAVLEPTRITFQIELGFGGGKLVPPQTHPDIALHQHPVRGCVVAGEIRLEVILSPRQHHISRSFHDHAVVKAFQMVGRQMPRGVASCPHGGRHFQVASLGKTQ